MKKLLLIFLAFLLAGCAAAPEPTVPETEHTTIPVTEPPTQPPTEPPTEPPDPIADAVEAMTNEEKVGQLFLCRYNSANALADTEGYHLGGWLLFSQDFDGETPDSIRSELSALQAVSDVPLLIGVDEEGGTVTRVSRYSAFRSSKFPFPRSLYKKGCMELVLDTEAEKSQLLSSLGINVNLAPVCDITTDSGAFMYSRSLGLSPEDTGTVVAGMVETMADNGVASVLKHFPGYGNNADTHVGIARDKRSLEELEENDLIPFRYGFEAGCGAVLVSHTIVECLDADLPASLSPAVIAYIREEMDFDGVIVTDDLIMEAITDRYGAGEAAIMAIEAGCDLLCSSEYVKQYNAVLAAVEEGRIEQNTLDAAVYRILRWKQSFSQ